MSASLVGSEMCIRDRFTASAPPPKDAWAGKRNPRSKCTTTAHKHKRGRGTEQGGGDWLVHRMRPHTTPVQY
eukprot:14694014-Alexandrium_andersonii.AAC.1